MPAFLALLEDALHTVLNSASAIVEKRRPPSAETEEEQKALELLPPEEPSPALVVLRGVAQARTLASVKDASKLIHTDSSDRLMQMG